MSVKAKKMAVLDALSRETTALKLKELREILGEEYAERSLRRWLSELALEGVVEKSGRKKATRYRSLHRFTLCEEAKDSYFSPKSEKIVASVRRPLYEREPVAYRDEWLEAYLPNKSFYIPLNVRLQLHKAGKRAKGEDTAGTYARQIFNRLLIDLSYNSSRLEGNTYSLLETQKLLLEGKSAEGKLDEEKIMILNHKEAIRYLVETAPHLEVNQQTICTLHYLLSDGLVETQYAGKIRDHAVRIRGSTYIPFEKPKQLQSRLEHLVKKAGLIDDPYEQSLFLLTHVSYLQAFSDVNKRTARLSANIPLIKSNRVPLSFNAMKQEDYTSAVIALYELQDIRPLLDLYVFSYLRTCTLYDSTVKALGFDEIRVRYRQQRRTVLRDIILRNLAGKQLDKYVILQTAKLIKKEDRKAFIQDIQEDLREMDLSRIAGLGVSEDELKKWQENTPPS